MHLSIYFIIVMLLILSETLAETYIKKASVENNPRYSNILLASGMIGYVMVSYIFYIFLKYFNGSFALANIIWQIGNILLITLVSILYFNTKLSYIQWTGFIFLIIGLILFGIE